MEEWSYEPWDRLLRRVTSPEGRVDYERLLEHRALLDEFLTLLAAASPESHARLFPTTEDGLAYWINAYNAFTLAGIAEEYPITSVWKTRDGQFFQRRRHLAGGRAVSLDDIEHTILRSGFREPRIHFAINCASNGCPPVRPEAYRGEGLRDTLRRATETFLSSEWNCRVDHATRRIHVSRLFKMYAEDFAGAGSGRGEYHALRPHVDGAADGALAAGGTREDYRRGVLRFIADHSGLELDAIDGYEVVYNVYDWGLNDTHRDPHIGPIVFHEPVEHYSPHDRELRELHLYEGNFCNRDCSWCTIHGSPDGWYQPYSQGVLDQALRTLAADGNLKFYGGEPTLHTPEIVEAIRYCRERGFRGLVTVFSNGVQADKLIAILESDPRTEAVLNYSIFHGRDAEPLPDAAKAKLEAWAASHPLRLFKGYKVLFHAGGGAGEAFDRDREAAFHGMGTGCVRCFPVLTTKGRFLACPFAAEIDAPHFDLGRVGSDPTAVLENYRMFLRWVDQTLDPAARARSVSSCEMCHRHLAELAPATFSSSPE
jgi:Protein of unknown function, DUF547/Radical SAM superfamily